MVDATFTTKSYRDQGGNRQVIAPGGELLIEGAVRGLTPGDHYYVDTVNGADTNTGLSWADAFVTMAAALAVVADNGVVHWVGDVREQVIAPLGVQGVRIVAEAGGRNRHDDGCRWRAPASTTAGKALLHLREQGWEVIGGLFVPDNTDGPAIVIYRAEDATNPDGSHCSIRGAKFIGGGGTPVGILDFGGASHVEVAECEFNDLTTAIGQAATYQAAGNPGIAACLRWDIRDNHFQGNTNDVSNTFSGSTIRGNRFHTAGSGATNKVINTCKGSDVGGNFVIDNYFNNTEVQIAPGTGFTGSASDVWTKNWVNNQAAAAFGQPA